MSIIVQKHSNNSLFAKTVTFCRCIRDDQRSFGLGIQWIKVRLLGTIPAPIIFGYAIDKTCILWQKTCDDVGACLLYDNKAMSGYTIVFYEQISKTNFFSFFQLYASNCSYWQSIISPLLFPFILVLQTSSTVAKPQYLRPICKVLYHLNVFVEVVFM